MNGRKHEIDDLENVRVKADLHLSRSDFKKAIVHLRKAAIAGDVWAQYHLGLLYERGKGVRRSISLAKKWYKRAADQNYDSAQLNLGILLAHSRPRQLHAAVGLYKLAALQGNRNAAYNLGLYYEMGWGVRKSLKKSFEWYRRAADLNDEDAMCKVGYCLFYGEGVAENKQIAVDWYRRAARRGSAEACRNLARCFTSGDGCTQNLATARRWARRGMRLSRLTEPNIPVKRDGG